MSLRVLIIEDDQDAAGYIAEGLENCGYSVEQVHNGAEGLKIALENEFEVLIVDRMLPELDGLSIIRKLREEHIKTPVLILSALAEVDDRVEGLSAGGDDYLVKPYAFSELLARLQALTRRKNGIQEDMILQIADLELDRLQRRVTRSGHKINLQPREFRLLEYLMSNAGQIVTRNMLLEKVWEYHFDPQTNVIDVHISRLRGKIDKDFSPPLIHTERGTGYSLYDPTTYRTQD